LPAETPKGRAVDEPAAEFLVRMAREHKGELVLCPVGPLTNIAAAIRLDPEFATNCQKIVLMGGSLRAGGNITPHAEANLYHDPHAGADVFASGADLTMIGLDVTDRTLCRPHHFEDLAKASPKHGGFLHAMSGFYMDFYRKVRGLDGCSLHDPAAVIACVAPELFTFEDHPIDVTVDGDAMGETVAALKSGRGKTAVAVEAQFDAVRERFLQTVATLP
ncbi:MAG: nucleoside hydrolase, partial [Pseudomonadota bacterium]